jgi:SAM-dependent methyltransferase
LNSFGCPVSRTILVIYRCLHANRREEERRLIGPSESFAIDGYCYVCKSNRRFWVRLAAQTIDSWVEHPAWREQLRCDRCRLNNRLRASIHVFEQEFRPNPLSQIFLSEQASRLFSLLRRKYQNLTGSEYLGDSVGFGKKRVRRVGVRWKVVRNETFTALSFRSESYDFILSFDVFEHIPNYAKAFQECFRCLRSSGTLVFSVPFRLDSKVNVARAHAHPKAKSDIYCPQSTTATP